MQKTLKCKGCDRHFAPDLRNRGRQAYCNRKECQRIRRTVRQHLRRQKQQARAKALELPLKPRRLQGASLIAEADIRSENPVIIGLISMITGSTDLESIERVYRQCWLRGAELLSNEECAISHNPAIISLLRSTRETA